MELGRTKNWFYALLAMAVGFILVLGAWWIVLVFKLADAVEAGQRTAIPNNLALMVKWEGFTFFILILALGAALFYVFWQDHRKTKSLQTFYATLTHELKTPLASMRLQSQVLSEFIEDLKVESSEKEKLERYGRRLREDVTRLENELDKHLHLSRTEGGGNFNLTTVDAISMAKQVAKSFPELELSIQSNNQESFIYADQTALSIIFKNLFENTIRHSKTDTKKAVIEFATKSDYVHMTYKDSEDQFDGNIKDLGKLFYKHNSPKGSGIGLYLVKKLTTRQGGKFNVISSPALAFEICLKKGKKIG